MDNKQKKAPAVLGLVVEALPDTLFRVKIENVEEVLLCYLAGKMRLHRIKVMIGDSVEVVIDPYGGKGRIVRRLDNRKASMNNQK